MVRQGADKYTLVTDSSIPLMHLDLGDLGSLILIQITPKEHTQSLDLPEVQHMGQDVSMHVHTVHGSAQRLTNVKRVHFDTYEFVPHSRTML